MPRRRRPWSNAARLRERSSQAFGLAVVIARDPRGLALGAGLPGRPIRLRVTWASRSTRSKTAALLAARSLTVKTYSSWSGSRARISTTKASPIRRMEASRSAFARACLPDLPRQRLVDALDVVLSQLLQQVEHAATGEDAELGALLERGDEEAGDRVELRGRRSRWRNRRRRRWGGRRGSAAPRCARWPQPRRRGRRGRRRPGEERDAAGALAGARSAGERSEAPRARNLHPSASPPDPRKRHARHRRGPSRFPDRPAPALPGRSAPPPSRASTTAPPAASR